MSMVKYFIVFIIPTDKSIEENCRRIPCDLYKIIEYKMSSR